MLGTCKVFYTSQFIELVLNIYVCYIDGSPVMDMLRDGNRSGQSSPTQGQREKRPSSRSSAGAQNGRGSAR